MKTAAARSLMDPGLVRPTNPRLLTLPHRQDATLDVIVMPAQDQGEHELAGKMAQAKRLLAELGGSVERDLKNVNGVVARIPREAAAALESHGLSVIEDAPVRLLPDPRKKSVELVSSLRPSVAGPALGGWDGQSPIPSALAGRGATAGNAQGPAESLYTPTGYTGKGVGIAILDSGVAAHPDLGDRIVGFADAVEGRRRPYDGFGHGTHCAGDAAGDGRLSGGRFKGPAPDANIIGIRVIGEDGGDRLSDAIDGIVGGLEWMVSNKDRYGIRVANLSLGLPLIPAREDMFGRPTALYDPIGRAINQAVDAGIVVVVAAGNNGEEGHGSIAETPAINPNVITVGALDTRGTPTPSDDDVAEFSSRGPTPTGEQKPDVLAPGVNVMSLNSPGSDLEQMNLQAAQMKQMVSRMGDRELYQLARRMVLTGMAPAGILRVPMDQLREALYESVQTHPMAGRLGDTAAYIGMDGTSMASPIVAGIAATILEANPSLSPAQVKDVLMRTARPLRRTDGNSQGAGVVDPKAAVAMAERMRGIPSRSYQVAPPPPPPPAQEPHRGWWERIFG